MNTNVLIVGAGEIGQAIAFLLKKAGRSTVSFWDSDAQKTAQTKTLTELAREAGVVFLAVPSKAVRVVLKEIAKEIGRDVPVVVLAKGLEGESGKTMDQVLSEFLRRKQVMLLYGPMVAEEISSGKCTAAVLAARSQVSAQKVIVLFDSVDLHLYPLNDLRGVALAGVLKNIYAIGLGIIHGLDLGANFRGWFVAEACAEMSRIIRRLGGKKNTIYSQAGIGDLVATGFSEQSRNHQVGLDLIKDVPMGMKSEGTNALPLVCALLGQYDQFVLLKGLRAIVAEKKSAREIFQHIIGA